MTQNGEVLEVSCLGAVHGADNRRLLIVLLTMVGTTIDMSNINV